MVDLRSLATSSMTEKERETYDRQIRIRSMVQKNNTPSIPMWWPGVDLDKQNLELDFYLATIPAQMKATKNLHDNRNMAAMLTSSKVEVDNKITEGNKTEEAKKRLGI